MTTRKLPAVLLAAALLSTPFAVTAHAATRAHTAMTRHHVAKPVHASSRATARAAAGADHSADSLNAQSLARSQGQ